MNAISAEPFLLVPKGKADFWGGTRLKDNFSKDLGLEPLAETWECSTHPCGASSVGSGVFQGKTLNQVLDLHPEFLGTQPKCKCGLQIMIKFMDANKDLPVQVHPDDAYAEKYENGALGKTKMWYVLEAQKDARIIYGFSQKVDAQKIRVSLAEGSLEKYLQRVHVKKGDVFFIPAGLIHAMGKGTLIAEIRENSDLDYQFYDYNRQDKNGNQRHLDVEKALDVMNMAPSKEPVQPMHVFKFTSGFANELICRCKYFQVEQLFLNTERRDIDARLQTSSHSFEVLLCTSGCGVMLWENGKILKFYKGDCIFIPANSVEIRFHGEATFLKVSI